MKLEKSLLFLLLALLALALSGCDGSCHPGRRHAGRCCTRNEGERFQL